MRKDGRYENADLLDKKLRERLFDEHIAGLERKRRDLFFQLLNDTKELTFNTKWRDARRIIEEMEKFAKIRGNDKVCGAKMEFILNFECLQIYKFVMLDH